MTLNELDNNFFCHSPRTDLEITATNFFFKFCDETGVEDVTEKKNSPP